MSEWDLVFEGMVIYFPEFRFILCISPDYHGYVIKIENDVEVVTDGAEKPRAILFRRPTYTGNELLSNGRRYWVRLSEPK
jgi:hypothetical protein